jgi:hypothetical protein
MVCQWSLESARLARGQCGQGAPLSISNSSDTFAGGITRKPSVETLDGRDEDAPGLVES